jgi:hypothetical protein
MASNSVHIFLLPSSVVDILGCLKLDKDVVSCECWVLSGRSLCVGLITRPEEPDLMCGVSESDCEASKIRRPWPTTGCCAMGKKKYEGVTELNVERRGRFFMSRARVV